MALPVSIICLRGLKNLIRPPNRTQQKKLNAVITFSIQTRFLSSVELTKNLSIISNEKINSKITDLKIEQPQDKPLLIMLSWLMAKKRYIYKYADIYLNQGFDVLNININPWQLMWPTNGSQVVAKDILKFLEANPSYDRLVVHGFSVGAYVWSEALVHMSTERQRYQGIIDRIAGQIWDSSADVTELSIGVPVAVFPNNKVLQNTFKQYILYHLKKFNKSATVHYVRASQMYHTNIVHAPAQIFISKTDPIGTEESNRRAKDNWENMGIRVNWKCWDKSPHVGHFRAHPEEYKAELEKFLASLNISRLSKEQNEIKATAKLG
ncbi:uncharacterized protein LOC130441692 [Diorhabda sublineata]|uniref:uncharacterized protein LOC130441692 n=1 Tax=Diorhabda sublineata TaxID=1163346 RepID=UPI0024E14675|nr:uncharacterized protein LOC130441692 [Diorhabda sublineata]